MKTTILTSLFLAGIFYGCKHEGFAPIDNDLSVAIGNKERYILPDSRDYANIPQSAANPLTNEKVELGKLLFFEPAFGIENKYPEGKNTFSCGSCHVPASGFRPGRMQGIADGGFGFGNQGEARLKNPVYPEDSIDAQGARPLSVLNVAFVTNSMWNGSFGSGGVNEGTEAKWGLFDPGTAINHQNLGNLEGQNIEGLKTHRLNYSKELAEQYGYKDMFDAAFPDVPEAERYSRKTASFAISAYIRTLTTTEAPFQRWLKGDEYAMTEQQKRGAILFFEKLNCDGCHFEANLGSNTFAALGVKDLFETGGLKTSVDDRRNLGRGGFTGEERDLYKFRVPQLYNLGDSGPYFHGSSKQTLEEVVRYFNNGIPENSRVPQSQLHPFLRPLQMTEQEIKDLTEFLEEGLRDPNLNRFVPEKMLSGMCFPNNDPESKEDMGCN